ncbi:MAG: hypothetical protein ACOZAN_03400 [Patescibacteria group bacterium]
MGPNFYSSLELGENISIESLRMQLLEKISSCEGFAEFGKWCSNTTPIIEIIPLADAIEMFNTEQKNRAVSLGPDAMVSSSKLARRKILEMWKEIANYKTEIQKIQYLINYVISSYRNIGGDLSNHQTEYDLLEKFFQFYIKKYLINFRPNLDGSSLNLVTFVDYLDQHYPEINNLILEISTNGAEKMVVINPITEMGSLGQIEGVFSGVRDRFLLVTPATSGQTLSDLNSKFEKLKEQSGFRQGLNDTFFPISYPDEQQTDLSLIPVMTAHRRWAELIRESWGGVKEYMEYLRSDKFLTTGKNANSSEQEEDPYAKEDFVFGQVIQLMSKFFGSTKLDKTIMYQLIENTDDVRAKEFLLLSLKNDPESFNLNNLLQQLAKERSEGQEDVAKMHLELLFITFDNWIQLYLSRHDRLTGLPTLKEFYLRFQKSLKKAIENFNNHSMEAQKFSEDQTLSGPKLYFIDLGYLGYFSDEANRLTGSYAIVQAICEIEKIFEEKVGPGWQDFFEIFRYAGDEIVIVCHENGEEKFDFSLNEELRRLNSEGKRINAIGSTFGSSYLPMQIEYNVGSCTFEEAIRMKLEADARSPESQQVNDGMDSPEDMVNSIVDYMLLMADNRIAPEKFLDRFMKLYNMRKQVGGITQDTLNGPELSKQLEIFFIYSIKALGGQIKSLPDFDKVVHRIETEDRGSIPDLFNDSRAAFIEMLLEVVNELNLGHLREPGVTHRRNTDLLRQNHTETV